MAPIFRFIVFIVYPSLIDDNQTLDTFLKEAELPPDAGSTNRGDLTLERVLEEKIKYDVSLNYQKIGDRGGVTEWTVPGIILFTFMKTHHSDQVSYQWSSFYCKHDTLSLSGGNHGLTVV